MDWEILIFSIAAASFGTLMLIFRRQLANYLALSEKGRHLTPVLPKFLERFTLNNEEEAISKESAASLKDRLEEAMAPFTRKGVPFKQLITQGLLTPSCGLASLAKEEAAVRALELLAELSDRLRTQYG